MTDKYPNPLILRDDGYPPLTWFWPLSYVQRFIRRRRWTVETEFCFASDIAGKMICVRQGFTCDLSSIPRLPLVFLLLGSRAVRAGVIHDWLYATGQIGKIKADLVYYEALRAEGYLRLTSALATAGVLLGGWLAWYQHRNN